MADVDVETVLKGKYPAKAHAKRVVEYIRSKVPDATGALYLEGRSDSLLEDSDEPVPFRCVLILGPRVSKAVQTLAN